MPLLPKAEGRSAPEISSYLAKLERLLRTVVQTAIFFPKTIKYTSIFIFFSQKLAHLIYLL